MRKSKNGKARGITSLWIAGYKSFAEKCTIGIRPLTLLSGANSSGKSSSMQPLLLLKQTLEAAYDPGPLLLDGTHVRFTSARQLFTKPTRRDVGPSFSLGVIVDDSITIVETFALAPKSGLSLEEMIYRSKSEEITFRKEMTHDEIIAVLPTWLRELPKRRVKNGHKPEWRVLRSKCTLGFQLYLVGEQANLFSEFQEVFFSPFALLAESLRGIIHVPGLRGNPERNYVTTAVGSEFRGTFEVYAASIIHQWQSTRDDRLAKLGSALEQLGLTWKVTAHPIGDTKVEIRVGRLNHGTRGGARDLVSIADVGFGVSQVLPVLVALLVAKPGQFVYLEQPEIHLHPRAQVELASILADAVKRGARVIVETHSSILLLAIQTLVAKELISPKETVLHWFSRNRDGATIVQSADLDEAGRYGDWPMDFAHVELSATNEYLDAVERHEVIR